MKFLKNKYTDIYNSIVKRGREKKPVGYSEKHHVVPTSLGGNNKKKNIVRLTAKEHYVCHLLLIKMVEKDSVEYKKMCMAWGQMHWCESKNQDRKFKIVNSRLYEKLRIEHSKAMKFLQKGKKNSQHGKIWIHNPNLKQSKKISKGEVPEGWTKGRILNWKKYKKNKIKEKKNPVVDRKCAGCDKTFSSKLLSKKKLYCSKACCQRWAYKITTKTKEIKRGDERKLVRPQDVPSYRKYGWEASVN